jgi:cytochrome P450
MTGSDIAPQDVAAPVADPVLGRRSALPDAGWIVTGFSQVRAVLADPDCEVAAVTDLAWPAGTINWLRASVSRFANGEQHARRRARVVTELAGLSLTGLRADAERRTHEVIDAAAGQAAIDVIASLARRVPMAALAASLGIADADRAAEAVTAVAAAYFPGADARRERAGDVATADLVRMLSPAGPAGEQVLSPADEERVVARITLLAQGCEATAGLIGEAVQRALPPLPAATPAWSTEAILAEVLRHDPPAPVLRRISRRPAERNGSPVPAGSLMLLRIDSANRDPAVFDQPDRFDPGRSDPASLAFGYGVRPCPADAHALMLAAGVVQAVRERCGAVVGQVEYEPPGAIRVPARVEVRLR